MLKLQYTDQTDRAMTLPVSRQEEGGEMYRKERLKDYGVEYRIMSLFGPVSISVNSLEITSGMCD